MLSETFRNNPGRVKAVVYAILVHVAVIGTLAVSFRWSVQSPPSEKVVQAVMVNQSPASPEPDNRKQEESNKHVKEQEQLEQQKKAEAERQRQLDIKNKKQEDELRQQEAEKKKKQSEVEAKRQSAQDKKKQEKLRQQHAEQSLKEQLAAEEQERVRAAQAIRSGIAVNKYKALIQQKVSRSWSRPVNTTRGLKCVVKVRLTPSGEVLSAAVVQSSGNPQFDRSVENAVYKAAPLPLPQDPTLFDNFREIEFLFNPEAS